ncbi:MAG: hypothetical protein QNL91_04925 [Candidatus Krumholzibacteria bacterium]|nr:hypothetical protein [Candidatus Krumholzibacteria bacterium]
MSKGHILIVDQDIKALEHTTKTLREAGFDVVSSNHCVSEVTATVHTLPDVVVMDACRNCASRGPVRSSEHGACGIGSIPTILLTERGDEVDHDCAFRAGVQKYLAKPCTDIELVLAIEELIMRGQAKAIS